MAALLLALLTACGAEEPPAANAGQENQQAQSGQEGTLPPETGPEESPASQSGQEENPPAQPTAGAAEEITLPAGQIYLYGETHGVAQQLDREFELWYDYYHNQGLRHLFVELAYYSAEYLNLWMQAEDDRYLDMLFSDWADTAGGTDVSKAFYQRIKAECPETVFHGTDVGHQYDTTGTRYLAYLSSQGLGESETCRLTREAIAQGERFYADRDDVYRENTMVENFIRVFDSLEGESVMGIYGSAHTDPESLNYYGQVASMAAQLQERYGDDLHTVDLNLVYEPLGVDELEVGGKTYTASYFGAVDLSEDFPEYKYREFWRLEDAYGDFQDCPKTGGVLPYNNFPMKLEEGQVFVIDYTLADGSVERQYLRSDGDIWNGLPATVEFTLE